MNIFFITHLLNTLYYLFILYTIYILYTIVSPLIAFSNNSFTTNPLFDRFISLSDSPTIWELSIFFLASIIHFR